MLREGYSSLMFVPRRRDVAKAIQPLQRRLGSHSHEHARFSHGSYVGGEKEQILTQRGKDVVVVKPRKGKQG